MPTLTSLPLELQIEILSWLPWWYWRPLKRICRIWKNIFSFHPTFQHHDLYFDLQQSPGADHLRYAVILNGKTHAYLTLSLFPWTKPRPRGPLRDHRKKTRRLHTFLRDVPHYMRFSKPDGETYTVVCDNAGWTDDPETTKAMVVSETDKIYCGPGLEFEYLEMEHDFLCPVGENTSTVLIVISRLTMIGSAEEPQERWTPMRAAGNSQPAKRDLGSEGGPDCITLGDFMEVIKNRAGDLSSIL